MTHVDLRRALVTPWLATPVITFTRTPLPPVRRGRPRLGADTAAPEAPSDPGYAARLERAWYDTTAWAHELLWGGAASLTTGIRVPEESRTPAAAQAYLAELLVRLGETYAWPADRVTTLAAAMRAEKVAGTVHDTVERMKAYGPPLEWPEAARWFGVAHEIQRVAAAVSAAESAGVVRSTAIAAAGAAKEAAIATNDALKEHGQAAGTGIGLGLGLAVAGVALVYLGPQLLVASRARRALA